MKGKGLWILASKLPGCPVRMSVSVVIFKQHAEWWVGTEEFLLGSECVPVSYWWEREKERQQSRGRGREWGEVCLVQDLLCGPCGRATHLILQPVRSSRLSGKLSWAGIILDWCEFKCHGSSSPHITADGKSQLSNFWGQVGHSWGVANLHNESARWFSLCPRKWTWRIGHFGICCYTLGNVRRGEKALMKIKMLQMKHGRFKTQLAVRKCQAKSIVTQVPDQYQRGIPLSLSWLN